jgi:capsular polysaccharide biosynthesis protein
MVNFLGWAFVGLLAIIFIGRFLDLRVKSPKDLPQCLDQKDES